MGTHRAGLVGSVNRYNPVVLSRVAVGHEGGAVTGGEFLQLSADYSIS